MLSYQHAYHAGNAADIHKHIALAELIRRLTAKPRGIAYLETHAGRGLYDLESLEALKTGEAARGIARLAPDPSTPYGEALAAVHAQAGASAYPGSPLIARSLLREADRMALFELHPAEHAALRAAMRGPGPTVAIHHRDGLEGALAISPPKPRRGLVLVDPSYEMKTEYAAVARFVRRLLAKWPEGVVLVWYPVLAANRHQALVAGLSPLPFFRHEVAVVGVEEGMTGSGLLLINPPHGAEAVFAAAEEQGAGVIEARRAGPAAVPLASEPGRA